MLDKLYRAKANWATVAWTLTHNDGPATIKVKGEEVGVMRYDAEEKVLRIVQGKHKHEHVANIGEGELAEFCEEI